MKFWMGIGNGAVASNSGQDPVIAGRVNGYVSPHLTLICHGRAIKGNKLPYMRKLQAVIILKSHLESISASVVALGNHINIIHEEHVGSFIPLQVEWYMAHDNDYQLQCSSI